MLIQWQKDSSNIPNADNETYDPLDSDIGAYLRATVTYKDPESGQTTKMANVQSGYVVLRLASNNNSPEFQDPDTDVDQSDTATREVAENTEAGENIGAPVRATDADSGQKLTYTLGGDSADVFDIDWATGQLKTKAALDEETGPSYTVTVRATDPAGIPQADPAVPDNSDEITVTITVTDVNEPPAIAGDAGDAAVTFDEETGVIATPLDTYMATDPEGVDVASTAWSTAGADGSKFEIDDGALTFKAKPDFEAPTDANKDNVYEVTVRAADADGYIGTMAVKVTFTNEDENGRVMLSKTRPRVGIAVKASVTDPDGSISGLTWQWFRSISAVGDFTAIKDAKSDTYTPVADDVPTPDAMFLRATASYTDGHGGDKSATGAARIRVAVDTRNRAPMFEDQDTETDGVQNTETTRKVEENIKADATDDTPPDVQDVATDNVGRPVMATDPDPNVDALTYTLGGPDAAKFRVRDNGQIEVGAGTMLDYETKTSYMVTVMAEDSFGDSASIMVTIMVTPVDEPPEIMRAPDANVAPEFASATTSRTVAENMVAGEDIGNPVAANDANGDALTYALSGTDAASFDIDPDTGQLMTKAALDFERKSSYSVTVAASDSGGLSDSIDVTITVTNVDEMGTVTLPAAAPVVGTEITATLDDPDGMVSGEMWQWARSADAMDGTFTNILGATSMNYTPEDPGDVGMHLRVTAMYTDGYGPGQTAHAVTANAVTAEPNVPTTGSVIGDRYDAAGNGNGEIERSEVVAAIRDYFRTRGADPTKIQVIEVIRLYLAARSSS